MQDYVVQYCTTKSLPFTVDTMTLNRVSATINTFIPKEFSSKSISDLMSKDYRSQSQKIRKISHVDPTTAKWKSKKQNIERTKANGQGFNCTTQPCPIGSPHWQKKSYNKSPSIYLLVCTWTSLLMTATTSAVVVQYLSTVSCDVEFNCSLGRQTPRAAKRVDLTAGQTNFC